MSCAQKHEHDIYTEKGEGIKCKGILAVEKHLLWKLWFLDHGESSFE